MSFQKKINELPEDAKMILACADFLNINPNLISKVETTLDGGGHYTGLNVVINIRIDRHIRNWVTKNLPQKMTTEIETYIVHRLVQG